MPHGLKPLILQEFLQTQSGGSRERPTTTLIFVRSRGLLLPFTLPPESLEQPLTTQAALLLPEVPQGSSLAGDQVQGAEGPKDQGKGKEKKSSSEVKYVTKDKDAAAKAKEAEARTKEVDNKAKDAPTSQPGQQEDPLAPRAKAQYLGAFYSTQRFCGDTLFECNVLILFNRSALLFFLLSQKSLALLFYML